jgi:hypothetical protein
MPNVELMNYSAAEAISCQSARAWCSDPVQWIGAGHQPHTALITLPCASALLTLLELGQPTAAPGHLAGACLPE